MPPRSRSSVLDACPGAIRPHQAADGGLARVRLPGGSLTSRQLTGLADIAARFGDDHVELTSRGNVQLRALPNGVEDELTARLDAVGLLPSRSHERVRNIIASPMSGRDTAGRLSVRGLVAVLDASLCAEPALARLSGRFLFTVDDGRGDVIGMRGDVGLFAVGHDRLALLLAGQDTGVRLPSASAARGALAAASAFLDERDALGLNAWRVAELPDGARRVTARLAAYTDAGLADPLRVPSGTRPLPIGPIAQRGGGWALSVLVPLGRLPARAALAIAAAASEEVLITPWRGVLLPDLVEPSRISETMAAHSLATSEGSPWSGVTTCAGRPGCASARRDVRADATDTLLAAAGRTPVHWVGCPRRCGGPVGRHVEVLATESGYQVTVDGEERLAGDLGQTAALVATARRRT